MCIKVYLRVGFFYRLCDNYCGRFSRYLSRLLAHLGLIAKSHKPMQMILISGSASCDSHSRQHDGNPPT